MALKVKFKHNLILRLNMNRKEQKIMKKKDYIRIACKNILFVILIIIIFLLMNETLVSSIVHAVVVAVLSTIFDIVQLRKKTQ